MPLGLVLSARHHVNWPRTERNRQFVEKFRSRTGRYPSYAAEGAYAGILAIAKAVTAVGNPDDTDALIKALEGMELELPEDPDGFCSRIDPDTHQIIQMQAIGTVIRDDRYPARQGAFGQFRGLSGRPASAVHRRDQAPPRGGRTRHQLTVSAGPMTAGRS